MFGTAVKTRVVLKTGLVLLHTPDHPCVADKA